MHSGRFVFSQVMDHLPMKTFRRCVLPRQSSRPILHLSISSYAWHLRNLP